LLLLLLLLLLLKVMLRLPASRCHGSWHNISLLVPYCALYVCWEAHPAQHPLRCCHMSKDICRWHIPAHTHTLVLNRCRGLVLCVHGKDLLRHTQC
jgi:hypothetical protein